ncbi:DUF371 domain-containing protein [Candidatus Woesearchaeota archaeon]|nr:DUF371 domain-containing protein [Candidatus Woesearchaeota archaeon]
MFTFSIYGHKNILGTHQKTIEFTKDSEVSRKGDCIVGVRAEYSLTELKDYLRNCNEISVIIEADNLKEEIICYYNKVFNDLHEIVVRKSDFISRRTLGTNANKAAIDISRRLIDYLKNPKNKAKVTIR